MNNLDFVTEKEIDGNIYTLYHLDQGDNKNGFTHYYFVCKNGDPDSLKQISGDPIDVNNVAQPEVAVEVAVEVGLGVATSVADTRPSTPSTPSVQNKSDLSSWDNPEELF